MKILIAEDDFLSVKLYEIVLKKHDLHIVFDGADFIERYNESFDAFILDLRMPMKDGYEVLNYLEKVANETPVFVISAKELNLTYLSNPNQEIRYIQKPINIETIQSKIEKVKLNQQLPINLN